MKRLLSILLSLALVIGILSPMQVEAGDYHGAIKVKFTANSFDYSMVNLKIENLTNGKTVTYQGSQVKNGSLDEWDTIHDDYSNGDRIRITVSNVGKTCDNDSLYLHFFQNQKFYKTTGDGQGQYVWTFEEENFFPDLWFEVIYEQGEYEYEKMFYSTSLDTYNTMFVTNEIGATAVTAQYETSRTSVENRYYARFPKSVTDIVYYLPDPENVAIGISDRYSLDRETTYSIDEVDGQMLSYDAATQQLTIHFTVIQDKLFGQQQSNSYMENPNIRLLKIQNVTTTASFQLQRFFEGDMELTVENLRTGEKKTFLTKNYAGGYIDSNDTQLACLSGDPLRITIKRAAADEDGTVPVCYRWNNGTCYAGVRNADGSYSITTTASAGDPCYYIFNSEEQRAFLNIEHETQSDEIYINVEDNPGIWPITSYVKSATYKGLTAYIIKKSDMDSFVFHVPSAKATSCYISGYNSCDVSWNSSDDRYVTYNMADSTMTFHLGNIREELTKMPSGYYCGLFLIFSVMGGGRLSIAYDPCATQDSSLTLEDKTNGTTATYLYKDLADEFGNQIDFVFGDLILITVQGAQADENENLCLYMQQNFYSGKRNADGSVTFEVDMEGLQGEVSGIIYRSEAQANFETVGYRMASDEKCFRIGNYAGVTPVNEPERMERYKQEEAFVVKASRQYFSFAFTPKEGNELQIGISSMDGEYCFRPATLNKKYITNNGNTYTLNLTAIQNDYFTSEQGETWDIRVNFYEVPAGGSGTGGETGGQDPQDTKPSYIMIRRYPDKTNYYVGETFDPTGMIVSAIYSDGSYKDITDYTIDPVDTSKPMRGQIFVRWEQCYAEFEYLVSDFKDCSKSAWYMEYVDYIYANGIMTGLNMESFGAMKTLSRAQFAVMLYRMAGSPPVEPQKIFKDVALGTWYTSAVTWAFENGIVTGYDATSFGPAKEITREQMVIMIYRYASYMGYDLSQRASLSGFKDQNRVSSWSKEAMEWAVAAGIISGKDNGTRIDPQGRTYRCECAAIVTRFLQRFS